MVPAAAGLDVVAADAAEGLPDAKGLAAELRAAIPALPQPEAPPAEDDSYFGTLMKSLSGIITDPADRRHRLARRWPRRPQPSPRRAT